jgi:iron(III) transport system ATP-binding protein
VSISYPNAHGVVQAVDNVTLAVPRGTIMALLGPSGCGKTSLLRAIAGLERPIAGSVEIDGAVVSSSGTWVNPERRSVGMVFQDGALFPHLTVAQNIAFGLRRVGRRDRQARVDEMLQLVELDGLADRLPSTLSGGQQQRVALARSLAPHPSILLLDEPFSALDAALRVQVRAEVARIVRQVGVTTIFVTHDQDEAFVLGDQVAVLRDGRIEQVGTPDELYRTPSTPWVAGFVGEANFLVGSVGFGSVGVGSARSNGHAGEGVAAGEVSTLLGPVPLTATTPPSADAEQILNILVRPEQVELRDGDCALITTVEYYGHDVRYELLLDDGSMLAARSKSNELRHVGDRVCARFAGPPTEAWLTSVPASGREPTP